MGTEEPRVGTSECQEVPMTSVRVRVEARGKFLFSGDESFLVRGVTYGTFRPDRNGNAFRPEVAGRDLEQIAENGFNAVRTYTPPPLWFLDLAADRGLRVMAGLPWTEHVTFLDSRSSRNAILTAVRRQVRELGRHPALLCYAIGNEIPAPIVRWHGSRKIQRFLSRLHDVVRDHDPETLQTYVNYPTTEYLDLPFVDFCCFNVYLESTARLDDYVAHLQTVAEDKPLLIGELGFDSLRNGRDLQAAALASQVGAVFNNGCAGAFVFSWTDEWHRGGHDVEDWKFGLTDKGRNPKPALSSVREAFSASPFPSNRRWPKISVVVCSYNGAGTIRECLDGLMRLEYHEVDVVVVDDGSTDETAEIAAEYPFRVIRTSNRGLSCARNTGAQAATGEIVAFIDDDAYPDPHWLHYLAVGFESGSWAALGGPNVPPAGDGMVAAAVAAAPGGPVHVLISDREAEHVPGCNMAFRKSALEAVGGFDPVFRVAGDDVDICWRLRERGLKLGFSPAAVVWHHRRSSLAAYWRQQQGYGKAEALLSMRWPERYNSWGHVRWDGRVYGPETQGLPSKRPFHGVWGSALFQSLYDLAPGTWTSSLAMPECYLVVLALTLVAGAIAAWTHAPYVLMLPLIAAIIPATYAILRGFRAAGSVPRREYAIGFRALTALLHVTQPLARLHGRIRHGLTPWRRIGRGRFVFPWPRRWQVWSERRKEPGSHLALLEERLHDTGAAVFRGDGFARWDLEVWAGCFAGARLFTTTEEHGNGRQMLRLRSQTRFSPTLSCLTSVFSGLALILLFQTPWFEAGPFLLLSVWMLFRLVRDAGTAVGVIHDVVASVRLMPQEDRPPCPVPKPITATELAVGYPGRNARPNTQESHAFAASPGVDRTSGGR